MTKRHVVSPPGAHLRIEELRSIDALSDAPAPWAVEADDLRVVVRDVCGGLVAECTDGFENDDGWHMAEKSEHIARLIAAAPELLAALRLVAASSFLPTVGSTRACVEAAIAKAEGRS